MTKLPPKYCLTRSEVGKEPGPVNFKNCLDSLKVNRCEILVILEFCDFYARKPVWVDEQKYKLIIKYLGGGIPTILFIVRMLSIQVSCACV
jgi:hypothetical protein